MRENSVAEDWHYELEDGPQSCYSQLPSTSFVDTRDSTEEVQTGEELWPSPCGSCASSWPKGEEPTTVCASVYDETTLNLNVPIDDSAETLDSLRHEEVVQMCRLVPLDYNDDWEQPLFDTDDFKQPTGRIKTEHWQDDNGMTDVFNGKHEDHTYASASGEGLPEDYDLLGFTGGTTDSEAVDGAAIDLFSVKEPPPELCFKADELERIGRRPLYLRHAKVEARKKILHDDVDKRGMALFERIVNRGVKNCDREHNRDTEPKHGRIYNPCLKFTSAAMQHATHKGRMSNSNRRRRKPNSTSISSGDSLFVSDSE